MNEPIFEHPDRWYEPAGTSAKGWPLARCKRPGCDDLVDANVAFKRVHDEDHRCREAVRKGLLPKPPRRPRRPVVYLGRKKPATTARSNHQ